MLVIKKGNLLNAKENLLAHQVNTFGSFGGGLALQIAKKYPHVEYTYQVFCKGKSKEELIGKYLAVNTTVKNDQYIINCFSQDNFSTDYEAVKVIFLKLKDYAKTNNLTIAVPYKMGAGISNGDFDIILDILLEIFVDYDLVIYKL